jgi:hypothetical protein
LTHSPGVWLSAGAGWQGREGGLAAVAHLLLRLVHDFHFSGDIHANIL